MRPRYRLRYQGLIPRTAETDAYYRSMEEHAAQVCRPDTEIEFRGMPAEFYPAGFGPADFTAVLAGDWVESTVFAAMAHEAEAAGFDGVLIGTLQEPGLQLARTLVDIPVVGYGQAATLLGRCVGDRHGVLAFNPPLFPLFRDRLNLHIPAVVGPVGGIDVTYSQLLGWFDDPSGHHDIREKIAASAAELVAAGATAVIPGQMLLAEVTWRLGIRSHDGVPVVDGLGTLVLLAEALCVLSGVSGMRVNRRGFDWAKAPAEITAIFAEFARRVTR